MFSAIIIDDEPDALEMLEWQLKNYCPQITIKCLCSSADEGIAAIKLHAPQLVFLDIEMPHKNGFEVIRSFPQPNFDIVFVTAYNQFAVQAFKVAALDYLMKPIDADDLVRTIQRFENKRQQTDISQQLKTLFQQYLAPQATTHTRVLLPTMESIELAEPQHIMRCESNGNYTNVFFEGGRKMLLSKTLKDMEEKLLQHGFVRIHHSYLVNMEHVTKYIRADGGMVEMSDGTVLAISRQRKEEFLKIYLKE